MISTPPAIACRAPGILARLYAATGGSAWKRVGETSAFGTARISGLSGSARLDNDLTGGRWSQRFAVAAMGPSAQVFDGAMTWSQDVSGGVHPLDAPFSRQAAVTNAYLTREGYADRGGGAGVTCLGTRDDGGRRLVLVQIRPKGGIPAILAIDNRTALLASVSERFPTTTQVVRYADYRQVGNLVLPFSISSGTLAEPEDGFLVYVSRYDVRLRARQADFARPIALHPAHMRDGAASTSVPLRIEGRQLLVWASIDGHTPMPFILDTGGHAILTSLAAKRLGLSAAGAAVSGGSGAATVPVQFTFVRSVRIGAAELRDQHFLVIPYPFSFYDRGRKQPLAGILGLEFFERFAMRIDYGRRRLTLTPLSRYRYHGSGYRASIVFQEDMPLTNAAADGRRGVFGVDTGNAGTVILFGDFLDRTRLAVAYPHGLSARGSGTGGTDTGSVIDIHHFTFAGRTFTNVPTFLTHMRSGSFSSSTEAGNFGYEMLARFVPTFDYADGTLYLDASPFTGAPPRGLAGLACEKAAPGPLVVAAVRPGSPASRAGIVAGDRIVNINGVSAQGISSADFYDMTLRPGSVLRLQILHQKTTKNVRLILR